MSDQEPIGYVRPGVLEALKAQDEPHERYPIQKRRGDGFEVPIYAAMPYKPREYSDAEIMAVDRKHVDHIIAVMAPPK